MTIVRYVMSVCRVATMSDERWLELVVMWFMFGIATVGAVVYWLDVRRRGKGW